MADARQAAKRGGAKTLAGKTPAVADVVRTKLLHEYEAALKWMQEGKFEKAKTALTKLLEGDAADLKERVRVHIAACDRQMDAHKLDFGTLEERYDYAVSLMNTGDYAEARGELEAILKKNKEADFAHYGLAVLASTTGQGDACLESLAEAIRLNAANRIQARGDTDFQDMVDDPRFTELLYPETN